MGNLYNIYVFVMFFIRWNKPESNAIKSARKRFVQLLFVMLNKLEGRRRSLVARRRVDRLNDRDKVRSSPPTENVLLFNSFFTMIRLSAAPHFLIVPPRVPERAVSSCQSFSAAVFYCTRSFKLRDVIRVFIIRSSRNRAGGSRWPIAAGHYASLETRRGRTFDKSVRSSLPTHETPRTGPSLGGARRRAFGGWVIAAVNPWRRHRNASSRHAAVSSARDSPLRRPLSHPPPRPPVGRETLLNVIAIEIRK